MDGEISDQAKHYFPIPNKIYCIPPNQNKCAFYSLICSDLRKFTETFKLGLFRQIEALACLIHRNGSNQIHKFLCYLLTQNKLPIDVLLVEFILFFHAREHREDATISTREVARRVRHCWTMPYLKAELMFSLRVLLSIIEEVKHGSLTKDGAKKKCKMLSVHVTQGAITFLLLVFYGG